MANCSHSTLLPFKGLTERLMPYNMILKSYEWQEIPSA